MLEVAPIGTHFSALAPSVLAAQCPALSSCAEVGDVVQDGCCLSQTLLDVLSLDFLSGKQDWGEL